MTLEIISRTRCFGGTQFTYRHDSAQTGTPMRFAAYVPAQAERAPAPVVWFLAGLTCTEENFTAKAGAQRVAAELGLILIAPDTSPRGEGVPDDPDKAYDFGLGAGFYVDATQAPWATHYRMRTYIEQELPALVAADIAGGDGPAGDHGPLHGGAWRHHDRVAQPGAVRLRLRVRAHFGADDLPVGGEGAGRVSGAGPGVLARL